jgi:hypothetical protein
MKRNLTVELDVETIRKARVLAAKRDTSISRLVAGEIERLVSEADTYENAKAQALALLEEGFDMGSKGILPSRDELHER